MATSVRQNSMPAGGVAAQQPIPATAIPADIGATVEELPLPAIVRFRQQSSPVQVRLDDMNANTLGAAPQVRIASVGLGYRIVTEHTAVFQITNASAGALVQTVGQTFPWSFIANSSIQINGGATVYSVSGYGGLVVAMRNRKGGLTNNSLFGGTTGLPDAMVRISTVGANLTPQFPALNAVTSAGAVAPLSGLTGFSVAASAGAGAVSQFKVTWYTVEKLAFSRDSLLGALPLQNNSTYATLTRQLASALSGTGGIFPFQTVANLTPTLISYNAQSLYKFWSVPSDPSLYAPMISNSYQVLEAPGNTFASTGTGALTYLIPQNHYLAALHVIAADNNGAYLNPLAAFQGDRIQYNAGSVIPINEFEGRKLAEQWLDYCASYANLPGYLLWDGNNTAEDLNNTDQAGWVDCYSTATPQFIADIAAGTVTPVTYSIIRESVVAGAVNVVAG